MKPALLLVEDDHDLREMLAEFLGHSFKVTASESLTEALVFISTTQSIDLVVTDFMLGDGDGLHIAEAVRVRFPKIPIILITGSSMDHRRIEILLRMSNTMLIAKPFELCLLEKAYMAVEISTLNN